MLMPFSAVLRTSDVSAYGQTIRPEQSEFVVTSRGRFAGQITKIDFHRLRMQCLDENLPRAWRVTIPPVRSAIWFNRRPGPAIYAGGIEVPQEQIGLLAPERTVWHRSTGCSHIGSMSTPVADLLEISIALAGRDLTPSRDALFMQVPTSAMERLRRLHERARHVAETAPGIIANPEAGRGLEQALIGAMVDCLVQGDLREDTASRRRHDVILRRFYTFVAENCEEPLYLSDVCAAIGVNQRSLHFCCNEQLGVGPKRYLTLRRLHLARRALVQAAGVPTSVTEIATRYGFWELGRFAVEYKGLFGETPSETLRREPG